MKKTLVFVSVLLLAAACGKAKVQTTDQASPTPQPQASSQPSSLKDLMMSGQAQKCQVSYNTNGAASQGTIYLAGGKMSGDFTASVNGKTQTSHMIIMDKTSYVWVDGMTTGFKMQAESTNSSSQKKPQQSVDPNAKYNYQCSAWAVDNSEFTLPTGVSFSDVNVMMQNQLNAGGKTPAGSSGSTSVSGSTSACAACNNAGAGKAQCLAALNCK